MELQKDDTHRCPTGRKDGKKKEGGFLIRLSLKGRAQRDRSTGPEKMSGEGLSFRRARGGEGGGLLILQIKERKKKKGEKA